MVMNTEQIISELQNMYKFSLSGDNLIAGVCPNCGKKELYTSATKPYQMVCNRLNKCGYSGKIREVLPHLFEDDFNKLAPTTS